MQQMCHEVFCLYISIYGMYYKVKKTNCLMFMLSLLYWKLFWWWWYSLTPTLTGFELPQCSPWLKCRCLSFVVCDRDIWCEHPCWNVLGNILLAHWWPVSCQQCYVKRDYAVTWFWAKYCTCSCINLLSKW